VRICKNCKYFRTPDDYALCGRDEKFTVDLVFGDQYPSNRYLCSSERELIGNEHCGEEGRFYEPKIKES